ncbi:MAG TPA: MotA/TolQ/ExbB proton channel family protein [Prosthecochloris aestuarii]|uniref:MotA/TolQ/ExbB proton channel family protein n=1 Tax=Prosthecochloris aestuarii TaxID=1102 RepID=A0A831SWK7_PROAE|nr:MotA/TolQ/ExbB proton channel family protein [Prosthecochloris sp.]HED31978.1 MotA/TolQ/ExbB proton channel family protein [Prosthecochloris aestuarii]
MDIITNTLYWLSTGLLVPVIVLLLLFFLRALLLGGSFYGQFIERNKNNREIKRQLENLTIEELSIQELKEKQRNSNELVKTIADMLENDNSRAGLNKLIGDYEIIADKDLGASRTLSKLGPMLGLMGTLIPMGPALVALAVGDVASMASNMQVAFATTVIGLFVGAIGFITLQTKQRWYADDMNTLDFIADSLMERKIRN